MRSDRSPKTILKTRIRYIAIVSKYWPISSRLLPSRDDDGCYAFGVNMADCQASVFLLMCNGQIETLEVL